MSPEARYAVYLVDPGSNLAGVMALVQELLAMDHAAAAEHLQDLPALIRFYESEDAARNLVDRFREFDAVAVVRPADKPLAPAPVEDVELQPAQRVVQWLLVVLGVVQLGVSAEWFREGRVAPAVFGLALAVYVLLYFGRSLVKGGR